MNLAFARTRRLAASAAVVTALVCVAALASAATTVQLAPGPYVIAPQTYWTSLKLTCPAGDIPCNGVVSLETASAIKPYSGRPKAKAKVADVAYSVPAGATQAVRARVYGPALAQAMLTHSVTLRLTAWPTGAAAPVATRTAVFTLSHR